MKISKEKLEIAMVRKGMNVKDLSEKSGVSTNPIYRLMNGKGVTSKTMFLVCDALGCDITEILED